ncbi:MAG: hypothetical protein JWM37_415 [Candidatus Saccharibacteria bacterium]|nr:hypothetical protein [Candidatus Saccharibacteria bacterium]
MRRPNRQDGFTGIELLVVVLIIAILLAIVGVAYKGVLARNRNQDRAKSVNAIQKQLEAYYQTNSHYPSLRDLNDSSWLQVNMKSLDTALLQDPSGNRPTLVANPSTHNYAYQPLTTSGNGCEQDDTTCATYTLTATLEGGGTYVKQNNN